MDEPLIRSFCCVDCQINSPGRSPRFSAVLAALEAGAIAIGEMKQRRERIAEERKALLRSIEDSSHCGEAGTREIRPWTLLEGREAWNALDSVEAKKKFIALVFPEVYLRGDSVTAFSLPQHWWPRTTLSGGSRPSSPLPLTPRSNLSRTSQHRPNCPSAIASAVDVTRSNRTVIFTIPSVPAAGSALARHVASATLSRRASDPRSAGPMDSVAVPV